MQNITYDPTVWDEFDADTNFTVSAEAEVKLEAPGALYLRDGRTSKLIGHGTAFKVTLPREGLTLRASAKGAVRIPVVTKAATEGEVYTNIDKTVYSAAEELVLRGLRETRLREQAMRREMRNASIAQHEKRVEEGLQEELPEQVQKAKEQKDAEDEHERMREEALAKKAEAEQAA
jgi:hypothetical protein